MKHIKLLAAIVAMTICGTVSAQENFSRCHIQMPQSRQVKEVFPFQWN